MTLNVRNAILDSVANALQGNLLDQPVINRTGLTGKYDFTVRFTPDASQLGFNLGPLPPGAAADPDGPPRYLRGFPATARTEARIDKGGRRCDGD